MFQIAKEFKFSASHQLMGLPQDHQCSRLHGHNYRVTVILESEEPNEHGFVVDYGDLKPFKTYLDTTFDHRHLNDVVNFQTSAESLAVWFFRWCKQRWPETVAVRVSETESTYAEYRE